MGTRLNHLNLVWLYNVSLVLTVMHGDWTKSISKLKFDISKVFWMPPLQSPQSSEPASIYISSHGLQLCMKHTPFHRNVMSMRPQLGAYPPLVLSVMKTTRPHCCFYTPESPAQGHADADRQDQHHKKDRTEVIKWKPLACPVLNHQRTQKL